MSAPAPTYEQEQESLRRELEGLGPEITAPKEPEVNPEVYRDVEPIIFRGFLTLPGEINTVPFIFKSLNHHEFEMLRFSGGLYHLKDQSQVPDAFWHRFLAYGVFMVEGVNILADRAKHLPDLVAMFADLPAAAVTRLVRYLSEVNRRATNAVALTEAYAMENYSRYRWAQLQGIDLTSPSITGVEGTQFLGLNWAQQTWKAINYFDDRNEQNEREWENAKFVGSCMAGKGISKIYQQDTDRRQKEKDERFSRKDKLLRAVLLGEKEAEKKHQGQGEVMIAARSVDELASQLERDLKGEKDWHDQVIERQERQVRANVAARQDQLKQLAASHEREFGDHGVVSKVDTSGLTPAQVMELVERKKQLQAQNVARRMVTPSDPDKVAAFMDKWGGADSGIASTDRDPSGAVPILAPRETGTPFSRKK